MDDHRSFYDASRGSTRITQSRRRNFSQLRYHVGIQRYRLPTDAWQHVFRIELPEHQHIHASAKPEPPKPHQCESTCEINQFIREMLHEYDIRNYHLLHNIYKIFPNIDIGSKSKFKRGLMDFVGVIGHQLFGFSTDSELQQLQNNIESILTGSTDVTKTLNSEIKNLFSSLKITNERIDSAMKNEKKLFDKFGSFARVMNKTLGTIYLNWITAFESIHSAVLIHLDLTDYHAALIRLASGKLDPQIISPDDLKFAELEIDKTIKAKYPGYSVIKQSTALQYSQHDCVAIRHNRTVFITKQFPITSWHQKFRLYQIRALQHPVTENEPHITVIENLPKYVMISEDTKYLLEFDDKPNTKHNIYRIGKSTIKSSQQNCVAALLQNDNPKIQKLCRMILIRNAVQPEIVRINSDHMLLVDIQQYTLVCPNENENKTRKTTYASVCESRTKQTRKKVTGVTRQ